MFLRFKKRAFFWKYKQERFIEILRENFFEIGIIYLSLMQNIRVFT